MQVLHISSKEAGQRLDKFLQKYMNQAPKSFIYKMLRKKNIVLNKKRRRTEARRSSRMMKSHCFCRMRRSANLRNMKLWQNRCLWRLFYENTHVLIMNKTGRHAVSESECG